MSDRYDGQSELDLHIPFEDSEDGKSYVETDKAHGIKINGQMVWLPKSQLTDFELTSDGVCFRMPQWLVEKKSLEIFTTE